MTTKTLVQIVGNLVDELSPLNSDDRKRAIQAAMTLLGDEGVKPTEVVGEESPSDERIHPRARMWMKQNDLSVDQLQQVFLIDNDNIEVISGVPGQSKKQQVRNAYILAGISQFLRNGEQRFDDAPARELCERFGFYDPTNHSKSTKGSPDFTGSKERGWTITQPGLRAGVALIKAIAGESR